MSSQYIYGKNSVKAVLETHPGRVFKISLADGLKPDKRIDAIRQAASAAGIPVQTVPRSRLDQMLQGQEMDGEATHQGVVASAAPKDLLSLPEMLDNCRTEIASGKHPRLLLLDGVTDPRNFGAILRIADAAGIAGVVIPKRDSAGFGPVVAKTASGAEETVNVAVVSNLNQAIRQIKDAGFWVAGAAHDPKAVDYYKQDYKMPIALVMGSEGKGLAELVRKNCDFLIQIPMHGTVDSLNVATATAVLLFEMVKP